MNMAGCALAFAVLTSCAGGGTIEVSESPSRSASQLRTPTVSLPTPTTSATRPEIASPTPREPSPALSSRRPSEEPTQIKNRHPLKNRQRRDRRRRIPRGHRFPVETTTTQTVTAAPSPSTVTRSVTISASPSASPSPSPSAAGEPAETSGGSWSLVGAGRFIACSRDSDAASRAGHTVDESGGRILQRPSKRWCGLPACSSLSWVNRALLIQVEGGWTVGENRIAAVEDRLTTLEASAPDDASRNWDAHPARCGTSVTRTRGGPDPIWEPRGHLPNPERNCRRTRGSPEVLWTRHGEEPRAC